MCWTIGDRHSRSPGAVRHSNAAGSHDDGQSLKTPLALESIAQFRLRSPLMRKTGTNVFYSQMVKRAA